MRILFFIGTLISGGKERRLIELLSYLNKNTDYTLLVVMRREEIDYPAFYKLEIPYKILTRNYKKRDKTLHFRFFRICKEFKPDIVHTWGAMPAFVSLLAILLFRIPHINSQITDAPPIKKWSVQNLINKINFKYSTIILANSYAGLKAYGVDSFKKSCVIYNGVNLNRFQNLPVIDDVKLKYNITSSYTVIMVASFTANKDYDLFIKVADIVTSWRQDITFIGAGGNGLDDPIYTRMLSLAKNNSKILFPGRIYDVESLVNACDIGVLFSPRGEGISNAIIEYMALGKPVIANDLGGTREIVKHSVNGFLITNETPEEIADLICNLLIDEVARSKMGEEGKRTISENFTLDKMGSAFVNIYNETIKNRS